MAKIRRLVRKVAAPGGDYFDEQLWPVSIAVVVLGCFLIGVSLAYLPLAGVPWYATVWPSLIGIPLTIVGCLVALHRVSSRTFRRSLQLSLVLCAILHVALVVQMIETRIFSGFFRHEPREVQTAERPPPRLVPEYRMAQLLPEEDRPRQEFEKPVPTRSPEPTRQPEQTIRLPAEEERSPPIPQPVPVIEQARTVEPDVVQRQTPNEAAPRLAEQTSKLSRQTHSSPSRISQIADLPRAESQLAASAAPRPQVSSPARQQTQAAAVPARTAEPAASHANPAPQLARRTDERGPTAETAPPQKHQRAVARPLDIVSANVPTAETNPAAKGASAANVTPRASTVERTAAEAPAARHAPSSTDEPPAAQRQEPATHLARSAAPESSSSATSEPRRATGSSAAPRRTAAAAISTPATVAEASPATAASSAPAALAEPAKLALTRGQAGTAGGGSSPNLDSSLPGSAGPALVASASARRAEATQRGPSGDALSPTAAARITRGRAGAEMPTATTKAELVDRPSTAAASQVAEVTASSTATLTRADSTARSGAISAAKGTGEVDLGPTQIVAEAGIGRASGGGQADLNFQARAAQLVRRSNASSGAGDSPANVLVDNASAPAQTAAVPAVSAAARDALVTRSTTGDPAGASGPRTAVAVGAPTNDISPVAFLEGPPRARADRSAAEATEGNDKAIVSAKSLSRKAAESSTAATTASEPVSLPQLAATGQPTSTAPEARSLAARQDGGAPSRATSGPLGSVKGPDAADTPAAELIAGPQGSRNASPASGDGPALGSRISAGAPLPRAATAAFASGANTTAEIPEVGPTSAVAQAESDHLLAGIGPNSLRRQSGDALMVDIKADDGPGGLGSDFTPEVGLNARQARADSLNVQLRSARFARSQAGGLPAVSTAAIVPADAYSSRGARLRGDVPAGGRGTPSPQTEEAIERGLAFLARYQEPEGGWSLQGFPEGAQLVSNTAATALAVIAFQGAGYNHREFQYKDAVRSGIDYLLQSQKENGDLFVPLDDASNRSVWLYSHSLAAIALCEAYGMTQDPALKQPAQRALDFIIAGQHAERGGWRYAPGVSADTSVSGWMLMALKTGELSGLKVPSETYARIGRWLDDAQQSAEQPHLYRYNPYAPDTDEQRHGRAVSKTMTAVGLLMRMHTGWQQGDAKLARGAEFLGENPPATGTIRRPERDTYYWYYATQVMYNVGGDHWRAWNGRLHPLLVDSQLRQGPFAGSWDPLSPLPDRWGPHAGRLYVTAMNLLSLEVQYRKLPMYESANK